MPANSATFDAVHRCAEMSTSSPDTALVCMSGLLVVGSKIVCESVPLGCPIRLSFREAHLKTKLKDTVGFIAMLNAGPGVSVNNGSPSGQQSPYTVRQETEDFHHIQQTGFPVNADRQRM